MARQKELGVIAADADLTARHGEIPAWDEMPDQIKPVLEREMEVYAGFLEHTDYHVGRVIDALEQLDVLDDTLVFYIIGDNGASAEGTLQGAFNEMANFNGGAQLETPEFMVSKLEEIGTPTSYNHYAVGWAWAMDAPYQRTKQVASHWGGTRNGTIVHWPRGITGHGGTRTQFCHVIDIAPTVLEAAGIPEPAFVNGVQQSPMEGTSMLYSLNDAAAPERHDLQFLVAGVREYGEPGVLVTFGDSVEEVTADVASLGLDLDGLQRDGLLVAYAFRAEPTEVVGTGEFGFEPLFLLLDDAIKRIGASRVVLDTIEALFGMFSSPAIVRAELVRLFRWLKDRAVTAAVTGERGENDALTRYGIEQYVSDCVIALDHRTRNEISTRWLQVVKYRGSAHGTSQYPFLITDRGFEVPPVTSVALDYGASSERISTGVPGLDSMDSMLSGGLFRGSAVLVSGAAGTGKTTLGAHLIDAACARGERALLILFEESPDEVIRNMRSVGLDLGRWVEAGLLRIWAVRSAEFGMDNHLAMVSGLVAEHAPAVAVVDGIASLISGPSRAEVTLMLARKFYIFKARRITAIATVFSQEDTETAVGVSSRADTWLLLRNVESTGERSRLLFVRKQRGSAHSDQVREFVLTDHGIELADVYVGPEGVLAGSARLSQEIGERDARLQ